MRLRVAEGSHTVRLRGGIAEAIVSFTISRDAPPALEAPVKARGVDVTLVANCGPEARIFTTVAEARASIDGPRGAAREIADCRHAPR